MSPYPRRSKSGGRKEGHNRDKQDQVIQTTNGRFVSCVSLCFPCYAQGAEIHEIFGKGKRFSERAHTSLILGLAHVFYAEFLSLLKRQDEAIAEAKMALDLDPFSLETNRMLGLVLIYASHYDAALKQQHEIINMDSSYMSGPLFLGLVYVARRQYDAALEAYNRALSLDPDNPVCQACVASGYALTGESGKAREILRDLEARRTREYFPAVLVAWVTGSLGEENLTFDWLETAYGERDCLLATLGVFPVLFDRIRDDPRFHDLLRRLNFPK